MMDTELEAGYYWVKRNSSSADLIGLDSDWLMAEIHRARLRLVDHGVLYSATMFEIGPRINPPKESK